ncbi:Pectinesterase inhibitor domain containing protein [Parasponia andersonii]|uniref:Pectinesterase inhibitor domain containing protein n=1 Tax=Parasponia andersonii TaxID=3476 RepID=A0A2P5B7V5_PARAD|nr:Pectinesterase inhibitor domain containing protein [Parasponia andersonii]
MATLLVLTGQAHGRRSLRSGRRSIGGDICRRADYPAVCRAAVKGQTNPYSATQAAVKQLISSTAAAKKAASKAGGRAAQVLGVCRENYDDALSSLRTSLGNMRAHDKGSFNSYVSAALTDYVTCDDAFSEMGLRSPLQKTNTRLRQMASNALYLATMWR